MCSSEERDRSVADGRSAGSERGVRFGDEAAMTLVRRHLDEFNNPVQDHWKLVKENPSRSVYRGTISGQKVYVKHFHSRGFFRRLSRALGISRAMREMELSQYLSSRGVPTPTVLAAKCADGVEWLATRAVAPAESADQWHEAALQRGDADALRAVRQATIALGRVIGQMHAAGVVHWDLHCGNVLVCDGQTGGELIVIDLHRGRRQRFSRRVMAANLAQLLHDRYDFTTRSDRLRFLKEYLAASGAPGTLRGWQMMIEDFARRHGRRYRAQRDRRVMGNNRYFRRIGLDRGWRGHVALASKRKMAGSQAAEVEFSADAWRPLLSRPELLLELGEGQGTVLKDSRSSLVVHRQITIGPHRVDVFVKRARRKHFWKIIVDCFRPSRPMRAFKLGHALLTQRIATALPLAALERRFGPILLDSILITEAVDCPRLHDFLNTYLAPQPTGGIALSASQQKALAQAVLWQMGRLLQKLHDNRFAHRDLKASNMLVRWSPGDPPEIVLVDLDGLSRRPVITQKRRFQGLMRLNVSLLKCPVVNRAGRLRMLLGYLRRPGSGQINFKPYWRMLEEWSERKLQQQIRSRRHAQHSVRQQEGASGPQPT